MRKLGTAIAGILLLVAYVAALSGSVAFVRTHGNSMYPGITTGDLVIVGERSVYHPGDVVAYHSRDLRQVVLHRIKAIHGNRYTFRGDHNKYDDPERPEAEELIGREVLHIPGGAVWLDRLKAPHTLAIIAFALVAGGGTATNKRRKPRKKHMAQHARPVANPTWLADLSRTSAAVAVLAVAIGMSAVVLAVIAWTRPTTRPSPTPLGSGPTLTFSYRAEVPRSPAYQGTTVMAPDPLFRSLVHTVQLSYAYIGRPGTVRLDAELSSANGWHARIPLQPTTRFDQARTRGQVELHLDDLNRRAAAAASVIGMPADQVSVAVVSTIRSADGGTFAPRLTLVLTPTQLRLTSDKPQLEFHDSAGPSLGAAQATSIEIAGSSVKVSALRVASPGTAAVALTVLVAVVLAGRRRSGSETLVPARKYRGLLLEVEPIISPPGRPVVEVTDFVALAKLATRYGVLVMHWTQRHEQTFVVHDDGIIYRYRVEGTPRSALSSRTTAPAALLKTRHSPGALGESASQV
jgi:signal peptidase I